ncbi:hypothetical protein ALDI51_01380 [Alicycliphilus denitrificans]|jgi:hypothetical protein|uniref:Hemerythrin domain-containing protein n=1 Tax=Alicycliphilus denitrificans TaxID=179636 RepID=A0A3R7LH99_9BURK|nr:hemerythrin domain-containing protein [Alicycliphilus denitrificans]OJW90757.1 MAG: hemerythrin [Alicycliphilus sp. 69-12]MBN9573231.1 hemerythrin domain-containing protein [Alicycliphilus denitrificans]RKJ99288.1 hemerythrin domain-containing protein [Alicycliphilus denitrificans]BCN36819.1 hypothetical protein ALDI51_01380 [Alicycliphilus denitrificans]HRO81327.1 hemerythrin domain-containing protein [Alicycliphilus denitrificans]
MNIDRFKHDHVDILGQIDRLRQLAHAGVEGNAAAIARGIVAISSTIKLHLAVEDRLLYPALSQSGNPELARLSQRFQHDMGSIATAFMAFARRWNTAESVRGDPQSFRREANDVLRRVYERMQRENREFYPRIEAEEAVAAH